MFTLHGWDPRAQRIQDWLAGRLKQTYPLFAGKAGAGKAAGLLAAGKLAVILDGLDEIPEVLRPAALRALNQQAGFRLVAAGLTYCLENPDLAKADGYAIDSVQKMFMKLA